MNSVQFFDAVRKRHDIPSDNKLAQFLEIDRTLISQVRNTPRKLDGNTILKVAGALDLPEGYVLSAIQAERATNKNLRRVWQSVARSLLEMAKKGQAAALVGVGIIVALSYGLTDSAALLDQSDSLAFSTLYIMRIWNDLDICNLR